MSSSSDQKPLRAARRRVRLAVTRKRRQHRQTNKQTSERVNADLGAHLLEVAPKLGVLANLLLVAAKATCTVSGREQMTARVTRTLRNPQGLF
jgi:hypothetical protein